MTAGLGVWLLATSAYVAAGNAQHGSRLWMLLALCALACIGFSVLHYGGRPSRSAPNDVTIGVWALAVAVVAPSESVRAAAVVASVALLLRRLPPLTRLGGLREAATTMLLCAVVVEAAVSAGGVAPQVSWTAS